MGMMQIWRTPNPSPGISGQRFKNKFCPREILIATKGRLETFLGGENESRLQGISGCKPPSSEQMPTWAGLVNPALGLDQ